RREREGSGTCSLASAWDPRYPPARHESDRETCSDDRAPIERDRHSACCCVRREKEKGLRSRHRMLPRAFDRLRTVSGYERCGPASRTQHEAGPRPRQHAQQFVTVITERYRARRRDLVSRRSTERRNAENETSLSCAMLQDPVQPIPTDEPGRGPQPGVGLCLSGGG